MTALSGVEPALATAPKDFSRMVVMPPDRPPLSGPR
jgi:hypothetical protein